MCVQLGSDTEILVNSWKSRDSGSPAEMFLLSPSRITSVWSTSQGVGEVVLPSLCRERF